ncbi:hypothetical protein PR001_g31186 [Phytophthora rubi]|uniref:Uncharacterized protein n=1 Tax=Phytophthora rubi TaxID=129364 RepID=A0A6A3GKU3_9STRA|nr:hypothetical protein PR001_g31186 [Phytophthora rubi]
MPVLVAGFVLCCWCQLPAWSLAAGASCRLDGDASGAGASCRLSGGASCRLGLLQHVPVAGLMPVLVAGFVLCCWCQLPAWSLAAGLMAVRVLVDSLMCCWRCQLPA